MSRQPADLEPRKPASHSWQSSTAPSMPA